MQVVVLRGGFGLENLTLEQRPMPAPRDGQVLVRVRSVALNYRDLLMVRGEYNPKQRLPLVPCSDAVGEVIAAGSEVTRVRAGDRVCPVFAQGWRAGALTREHMRRTLGGPLDGTLAEYAVFDAEDVVRVPEHLSDEEAASLPCAGVTAWNALVTQGGLHAGQVVLTEGSGGVSLFALQIARALGARVVATSSDPEKRRRLHALGAEEVLDHKSDPEWGKTARSITQGDGVDHVVDVGGTATIAQALRAVKPGGTISVIGNLTGGKTQLDLVPILMQNIRLQGVFVGHRDCFEALSRAVAATRLKPVVDRTFGMHEVRAAFEHLASGRHFGKVCIRLLAV